MSFGVWKDDRRLLGHFAEASRRFEISRIAQVVRQGQHSFRHHQKNQRKVRTPSQAFLRSPFPISLDTSRIRNSIPFKLLRPRRRARVCVDGFERWKSTKDSREWWHQSKSSSKKPKRNSLYRRRNSMQNDLNLKRYSDGFV